MGRVLVHVRRGGEEHAPVRRGGRAAGDAGMTTGPDVSAPPKDYRLLVPREWFRIDLGHDRWRRELKTFVDRQAEGRSVPAEVTQEAWTTLRNTAEAAVAKGALEFFLRPELRDGSILPASLVVSLIPTPGAPSP